MSVTYYYIIKTRPICMFCIQVERGWLLETNGNRRTMFRIGPVHTQDNGPEVSDTEPKRTARYRVLLYARRT